MTDVLHPLFNLILKEIFFSGRAEEGAIEAKFGHNINLNSWFNKDQINGQLTLPDGSVSNIISTRDRPYYLALNDPGVYKLKQNNQDYYRLVNFPREIDQKYFTKKEWQSARPNSDTEWLKQAKKFQFADFRKVDAPAKTEESQRYDLSPVCLIFLLAFVIVEVLLLYRIWTRRAVPVV